MAPEEYRLIDCKNLTCFTVDTTCTTNALTSKISNVVNTDSLVLTGGAGTLINIYKNRNCNWQISNLLRDVVYNHHIDTVCNQPHCLGY